MLPILAYLVSKIYNNVNLRHSSTTIEYKWENNKPIFTFLPHIMAKFTKYKVRTFLVENPDMGQKYSFCNSGGEVKISDFIHSQLFLTLLQSQPLMTMSPKPNLTLPYCTVHVAGSHKAQGATQYKEPYRPSPDNVWLRSFVGWWPQAPYLRGRPNLS